MIKKQLLILLILMSSLAGYSQTITPQWKALSGGVSEYHPGKTPSGYDSLMYVSWLRGVFKTQADSNGNRGYVTRYALTRFNGPINILSPGKINFFNTLGDTSVYLDESGIHFGPVGSIVRDAATIYYDATNAHVFRLGGTEQMRMDVGGGGNTLSNTWTANGRLQAVNAPSLGNDVVRLVDIQNGQIIATDANFTMNYNTIYDLPTVTANRTISFAFPNGAPSLQTGKQVRFWNKNTSTSFSWAIGGAYAANVLDVGGTPLTTLANNAFYTIISDGTNWVTQSIQYNYVPANKSDNYTKAHIDSLAATISGKVSITNSTQGVINAGSTVFQLNSTTPLMYLGRSTGLTGDWFRMDGGFSASSGRQRGISIFNAISQTGTAGYDALFIAPNINTSGSGGGTLIRLSTATANDGGGTVTDRFVVSDGGIVNVSGLTASKPIFTDASKNLTSTGPGLSTQVIMGDGSISTLVDNVLSRTANYTIVSTDFAGGKKTTLDLYVDATAGNVTITMPSATTFSGYTIYVTKTDSGVNTVTINTVIGLNTLISQYQERQYNSNGSSWFNH